MPSDTAKESNDPAQGNSGDSAKKDLLIKERQLAWEENRKGLALKVEVETLDFDHFKNRYSADDGLSIIEVLQGHTDVAHDIRQGKNPHTSLKEPPPPVRLRNDTETWIQRVRIQSPQLLLLLSRLTGHGDSWGRAGPRVFFRPFAAIYHYLPRMKECMSILEAHWSTAEGKGEADTSVSAAFKPLFKAEAEAEAFRPWTPVETVVGPIADSITALQHIRKYVEFVETNIVPLWDRAAGTSYRKVRFADLWMLYQPGELIYVPAASESTATEQVWPSPADMPQNIWRLHTIYRQEHMESFQCDIPAIDTEQNLVLWCYYIEFNGTSYEPYAKTFYIPAYEGLKDISTLQAFPLRFRKEAESLVGSKQELGKSFQMALTEKHLHYDGWTLTLEPTHSRSTDTANAEYVNGQVMVDFSEGHKWHHDLGAKSESVLTAWLRVDWQCATDSLPINHYGSTSSSTALEVVGKVQEIIQLEELLVGMLSDREFETNAFLRAWKAGQVTHIGDEDLVLLPRRVVGYAFRERRFLRLDVEFLSPIPTYDDAFQDLQIDPGHKQMVQAIVKTHFEKQSLHLDLVRGKGAGLVILLHGAPGVGKTATAEAVAQTNRKPLFTITCGDLGFGPDQVEDNLKRIFRLAYRWDCVLLLDEADIFLTRRDGYNVKRNAIVSVFLRVLEYYSGILFLTTNRVGLMDEAFKSRIHLSLLYQPLSREQTLGIFRTNIRKLRKAEADTLKKKAEQSPDSSALEVDAASILDYAAWHYDKHVKHRWNGRQIRNAFQIAYSFAHFDMQPGAPGDSADPAKHGDELDDYGGRPNELSVRKEPVLDARQFVLVADAILRFDSYLEATVGESDSELAFQHNWRNDNHEDDHKPVAGPASPPSYSGPHIEYSRRYRGGSRGDSGYIPLDDHPRDRLLRDLPLSLESIPSGELI
ncbi:hypothetical protein BJX76DRAFT_367702 [Aspergillus varians]